MGGSGSTRWKNHQKASAIEDCHQLNVAAFEPALNRDQKTGVLRWTNSQTGEVTGEFVFVLGPVSRAGTRRLVIEPTGEGKKQWFQLERAQTGWLFRCPMDCGRRSRQLYALPKWMTFTCRQCGGLSYRSSQQHDGRVDLAARDPWGFRMARSRVPQTQNTRCVTAWLLVSAVEREIQPRTGRGWGRRSITSGTRLAAQIRQEHIDVLEDSGRIARGGQMPERSSRR